MKNNGFSDWHSAEGVEFYVGNYQDGRKDISRTGMLFSDREINGSLHLWLVYYPSNQTLDAIEFRH